MSTTCWGSLFVTLGELPSNFPGCSSVLLRCFSFALGKIHCCSRNKTGSCHPSSSFSLSWSARSEGWIAPRVAKGSVVVQHPSPLPPAPRYLTVGSLHHGWLMLGWLWIDLGLALGWLRTGFGSTLSWLWLGFELALG